MEEELLRIEVEYLAESEMTNKQLFCLYEEAKNCVPYQQSSLSQNGAEEILIMSHNWHHRLDPPKDV